MPARHPSADARRRIRRAVRQVEATPLSTVRVRPSLPRRTRARVVLRGEITTIADDTITIQPIDAEGNDAGDPIVVAKPYKLRHAAAHYEGLTGLTTTTAQEVEATDGTETETWIVVPSYQVDDVVYALAAPTDVSGAEAWVDLNVDGRAWSLKP